jgi:hypothetical protein
MRSGPPKVPTSSPSCRSGEPRLRRGTGRRARHRDRDRRASRGGDSSPPGALARCRPLPLAQTARTCRAHRQERCSVLPCRTGAVSPHRSRSFVSAEEGREPFLPRLVERVCAARSRSLWQDVFYGAKDRRPALHADRRNPTAETTAEPAEVEPARRFFRGSRLSPAPRPTLRRVCVRRGRPALPRFFPPPPSRRRGRRPPAVFSPRAPLSAAPRICCVRGRRSA